MKKDLQNFSAAFVSQIASLAIGFWLLRIYTQTLGAEEFGLFSLLLIIPGYIGPLLFFEALSGFTRFYLEKRQSGLYFSTLIAFAGVFLFGEALMALIFQVFPIKEKFGFGFFEIGLSLA